MRAEDLFREIESEIPELNENDPVADLPFFLAHNLYRIRTQNGMTQDEVAAAAGMRQPRIAEIERGDSNPTLSTIGKLARAIGVSATALLADPGVIAGDPSTHRTRTLRLVLVKESEEADEPWSPRQRFSREIDAANDAANDLFALAG